MFQHIISGRYTCSFNSIKKEEDHFLTFCYLCRYSINGAERVWLGDTYTNKFYISNLNVEGAEGNVQFTVQVLYKSGVVEELGDCGTYTFSY